MAEHWVELVQFLHPFGNRLRAHVEFGSQFLLRFFVMRKELVQGWIEETNGGRQTLQFGEHPDEIFPLIRQQLRQSLLSLLGIPSQDHLAHGIDAITLEEHVFGAAEPYAGGAE